MLSSPRLIACLVYPGVMSLDVTGPLQVFASANAERQRHGLTPCYRTLLLGAAKGAVETSAGLSLHADAAWPDTSAAGFDTLLVPGGDGLEQQCRDPALLDWLKRAEPQVRRLGSVCSGALLLAAAGLLDGHLATTHWADLEELRGKHPKVKVQGELLHTYEPRHPERAHLFTSAGVTAGIDMALALVEADLGRPMALAVARRLVMFLRRPGGQAQFSPLLAPETTVAPRLAHLLDWIPANLAADLSLEALARQTSMAPRTLSRVFVRELGIGPGRYVEQVRLEAARSLLQQAGSSVATVARLTGFGHPENLRRVFHKHLGVSPQAYAERFG